MRLSIVAAGLVALWLGACAPSAPELKPHDYPALGFSVSLPGQPTVTDTPAAADSVHTVTVEGVGGGRDFSVSVTGAPGPKADIDTVTAATAGELARSLGGQAGVPTYAATAGGVIGRELVINKAGRAAAKMRVFMAGGRVYALIATASGGADEDAAVDAFLTSFRLTAKTPAAL